LNDDHVPDGLWVHITRRNFSLANTGQAPSHHVQAFGDARAAERSGPNPYFPDVTLVSAFAARWRVRNRVETAGGAFQVREDEPAPRVRAGLQPDAVMPETGPGWATDRRRAVWWTLDGTAAARR
jgi:hypothetical protein